ATGAVAMPLKEPGPDFGTAEHASPKVWADASVPVLAELPGAVPSEAVELLSLLPHAARPSVAPSAIAAIPVRRISLFMASCCPFTPVGCGAVIWHSVPDPDR